MHTRKIAYASMLDQARKLSYNLMNIINQIEYFQLYFPEKSILHEYKNK